MSMYKRVLEGSVTLEVTTRSCTPTGSTQTVTLTSLRQDGFRLPRTDVCFMLLHRWTKLPPTLLQFFPCILVLFAGICVCFRSTFALIEGYFWPLLRNQRAIIQTEVDAMFCAFCTMRRFFSLFNYLWCNYLFGLIIYVAILQFCTVCFELDWYIAFWILYDFKSQYDIAIELYTLIARELYGCKWTLPHCKWPSYDCKLA